MTEAVDPLDPLAVHDRASFLAFVAALVRDREASAAAERAAPSSPYGPDAGGWENVTVESFLFAALRWAEAGGGLEGPWKPEPSWQAFARFLSAGKVYE